MGHHSGTFADANDWELQAISSDNILVPAALIDFLRAIDMFQPIREQDYSSVRWGGTWSLA